MASSAELIHSSEGKAEFMDTVQGSESMWWWKPVKMLFCLPLLSG